MQNFRFFGKNCVFESRTWVLAEKLLLISFSLLKNNSILTFLSGKTILKTIIFIWHLHKGQRRPGKAPGMPFPIMERNDSERREIRRKKMPPF